MTEDTTPEPLNLDTAALRERGPYITSMASDGYPIICVDTDSWNAMCAEVDRLRAALSAAVGVKAAPTKTTHKFLLGNDETGACRSTVIRVVAGFRHTVAEYCGQLPEAGVHYQPAPPADCCGHGEAEHTNIGCMFGWQRPRVGTRCECKRTWAQFVGTGTGSDTPPSAGAGSPSTPTPCAPFDPAEHYEEVLRAGLRWRRQSELQDERIDRLRRAVAALRAGGPPG